MAFQADCIHIGLCQQFGIRSTVRVMTGRATFGLDRGVPINERSGHSGVAFCAYIELPSENVALTLSIVTMCIVTICTLDQPLCNLVAKGHGELRLDVIVALVAQFRLRQLEQMLRRSGCVDSMTGGAAHIALAVG
jgi:hypothetical protein